MTAHDQEQLSLGLADLWRFERGHAAFELGDDGQLRYLGVDATVKMADEELRSEEGLISFIERLKRDHGFQRGDGLHFINNGKRIDTARILRRPRPCIA
jgi:hypothetical protein